MVCSNLIKPLDILVQLVQFPIDLGVLLLLLLEAVDHHIFVYFVKLLELFLFVFPMEQLLLLVIGLVKLIAEECPTFLFF